MLQQKYLHSIYLFVFHLFWQQKQPPQVFCRKDVLKNFRNVYRKTSALDSLFNRIFSTAYSKTQEKEGPQGNIFKFFSDRYS